MSKEFKPQVYNFIRRGWYDQLANLADTMVAKKGKDPIAIYWKAFATGMVGNISDCLRLLEMFQSRRDLQFPVALALVYFHKKASHVDQETVDTLKAEMSVAEDVTKEAGLILAARFCLYTGNLREAQRICDRVLSSRQLGTGATTAFEMEAQTIQHWIVIAEVELAGGTAAIGSIDGDTYRQLKDIGEHYQAINRGADGGPGSLDADSLMAWTKSRYLLGYEDDVLNVINQIIAMFPWFLPGLADKALILATAGEWEQALDTAQRLLDVDSEHLDALKIIAVHAFTQESQPHDAIQKLEDLENSIAQREPNTVDIAIEVSALFSRVSARQPRALQICGRLLERACKHADSDERLATVLCQLGHIYILQGYMHYEKAMKAFREATKRDPNNAQALEGMILCQLCEGAEEDAESQIELLTLMHSAEELGYEFAYLQSLMLRGKKGDAKKDHLSALIRCRGLFLKQQEQGLSSNSYDAVEGNDSIDLTAQLLGNGINTYLGSFSPLLKSNPDFAMVLAIDFFHHMEATSTIASYIPSTSSLLNSGGFKGALAQQGGEDQGSADLNMGTIAVGVGGLLDSDAFSGGIESPTKGGVSNATAAGLEISQPIQLGLELLQQVLKYCPGMISAYVELARCYAGLGMFEEATRSLQQCLNLQPNCSPVLVAMASCEAGQMHTAAADRVLEQALACDFAIRSAPRFRLVKSVIRAQQGRLDEAINEIEAIMTLPDFNFTLPSKNNEESKINAQQQADALSGVPNSSNIYSDSMRLTEDDRVGAFVVYAALLGKTRRLKEANKVLSHAKSMFAGSSQEVQVLVAASQLYVEKSDFDSAIRMLDKISEDSPTFSRAQLIKADIVLNHNHDKEGFTRCYQQLAERDPTAKNFGLLGEAYLRILNPESAIDALERAYKLDPKNGRLRGRIGRALVATHEYHRAVEFYESAIREVARAMSTSEDGSGIIDFVNLSHDLAKLYIKLGRAESSIRVLNSVLQEIGDNRDITALRQGVTTLLLLAKVQKGNLPVEMQESLEAAYKSQKELLMKLRSGAGAASASGDVIEREKSFLSDICSQLGSCHVNMQEMQSAEQYFQEAVQHNLQNTKAMLGLAKILHSRGDREQCQAQCTKIITAVPTAEEAAILLSECIFHSDSPDNAVEPLQNLLKLQPNNYNALERAISLLRRAGHLDLAVPFFTAAEKYDRRCVSHAGYHYCCGLYARFTNDIGKAISEFNLARKDEKWGAQSLTHMVELYLNPDQEGAWEEKESGPLDETTRANIAAAEELLKELRPISDDKLRVQILENYCLLATRNKSNVDRAMQSFVDMLEDDQDYLPAVLGMATGFMVEKNSHKARNLLKRVGKMEVSRHDGEDFEKANLLLAKFYIDKGKNDLAQDLCRKTLLENKSCSQAWEILGLVFEKEGNYELASDAYAKAWKLEFEASASVGFKLAFTLLKCKQYVEAIDICEMVLNQYPDYPRISEEILRKAQESIRTAQ